MIADDAVAQERNGNLTAAAELYEQSLAAEPTPLWAVVNLMCLYWKVTEFGFWTGKHLPTDFVGRAGVRLSQVMRVAEERFPDSTEVAFWCRYIRWTDLGGSLNIAVCEEFLRRNPEDLSPVLFLYTHSTGDKWEPQALRLVEECNQDRTTKANYVVSVIEASHRRRHWPPRRAESSR